MCAPHILTILAVAGWLAAAAGPMPFTTLAYGDRSHIEEPRHAVVRSRPDWLALWKQHAGSAAAPAVDFERSMVIAVFLGSRPTAGYSVRISQVERQADAIVAVYEEKRPASDAIVAQVLTAPFDIVRIDRDSRPVRFRPAR